jgi:hypothetical protein
MAELASPFSLAVSIALIALITYWESEIILTGKGRAHKAARTTKISACCAVAPRVAMFICSVHVPEGELMI